MADTSWSEKAKGYLAEAFLRLAQAQRHLAKVRAIQGARRG